VCRGIERTTHAALNTRACVDPRPVNFWRADFSLIDGAGGEQPVMCGILNR